MILVSGNRPRLRRYQRFELSETSKIDEENNGLEMGVGCNLDNIQGKSSVLSRLKKIRSRFFDNRERNRRNRDFRVDLLIF